MGKLFKIIYYVFIGCIALVAFLLIANKFSLPGGNRLYVVQSGSMEPTIHTGSMVVVTGAASYDTGDIITFGLDSKDQPSTTHRIAEKKPGQYVTKGDANNTADIREITDSEIIGKVRLAIPWIGFLLAFAKTSVGFVILIVMPAVIVIYDETRNLAQEIKRLSKPKDDEKEA